MELTIEKLIYGGDGLSHLPPDENGKGKAVFVPFVLPGEHVEARIAESKPGFARAELMEVLEAADGRIEAGCPYFGQCGGCQYQHASYEQQLRIKSDILHETLRRIAKLEFTGEIRIHPSPPWNYRNRTRLRFGTGQEFAVGYNRFASHELLPVRECPISSPLINRALATLWKLGEAGSVPASVAEIEFFANADDSELLLELTVSAKRAAPPGREHAVPPSLTELAEFSRQLRRELPNVVGIIPFRPAANAAPTRMKVPARLAADFGASSLLYRTSHANYRVSAGSFFQTNRLLIDEMIALVTGEYGGGFALDLYAGAGLFSFPLGEKYRQVAAVESAPSSFDDLRANAPRNVTGYGLDVQNFLAQVPRETRFDYVVADPPRGGMGERVARAVAGLKSPRLTYVSCDPATLARDLRALTAAGYRIHELHLLDLFPQTFHIETVVQLGL